ncbi:MAG: transcriptional regulator [Putridiphycobacter sp.]|nr:transcriptional regulator [Putridiphycobacter sp.]
MGKIDKLNKAFESRVRLGIMSILMVNEWVDYKELKSQLNLTDGNLASHAAGLEKMNYVEIKKGFIGKKTNTSYKITKLGRAAFNTHLNALENLLKDL